MYIRPNSEAAVIESRQKNDLFRRFKDYFIGATEKEFMQFDSYGRDGYISVNPLVEERVTDTLTHNIDEVVPITGATGIGKTYLILYCLKEYYDINTISTNHPELFDKNGLCDLVYYSDFHITEPALLKDPTKLILAKIQAMYERLMSHFGIKDIDVDNYIQQNKLEVKYYSKADIVYQKELYKLTILLSMPNVSIKNIVFIFDDLESLDVKKQYALVRNFLTLFENFKNKSNGKYHSKFIYCLRNSTYYNIYRQDFYNTHRASKASCLTVAPSLSEVFKKRFDIILKSDQVKKAKNITTWKEAKEILLDICFRVDKSYSNLIIKLNNNNISNALEDFLNIVSNRRWTQKNVNPAASFKIEKEQYYINDTNILRILSMGEQNVYYQSSTTSIRCILPDPGNNDQDDFINFLILQAFRFNNHSAMGDITTFSKLLSVEELGDQLTSYLFSPDENNYEYKKNYVKKLVETAFIYYEENRFIRKNIDPEINSKITKYYMLPRGEQIFDLFFTQTILFTIFRDAFLWNDKKYDIRYSDKMSFADLLTETIKYEKQLINLEVRFFNKITQNKMWRAYISLLGAWSVSESFLKGIKKSVQQYYGESMPYDLQTQIKELEDQVYVLTRIFETEFEENSLF